MLILLFISAALLGYGISAFLLLLLFHPRNPVRMGSMTFHGILPSRRESMITKIAATAAATFNTEQLLDRLDASDLSKQAMPVVEARIDHFIHHKLKEEMPLLSMFINEKTMGGIKKGILTEVEGLFPELLDTLKNKLRTELDIEMLIQHKLMQWDPLLLENSVKTTFSPVFTGIKLLGAVIALLGALCSYFFLQAMP